MSTTDRNAPISETAAIKAPVVAATTANITLSGPQTIDGVAVVSGDRVLVKNQTDQTENGIYIVKTAAWRRALDFYGNRDVTKGTLVYVLGGTVNGEDFYQITTANPISIGSSNLTFGIVPGTVLTTPTVTAFTQTILDDDDADEVIQTIFGGDADIAVFRTLIGAAALSLTQTFTGAQIAGVTALMSAGGSIAVNMAVNNDFTHTFTENTTLENPTNATAGQSGAIRFTQHASAPKTLAFGANWKFPAGVAPSVSASNSAADTLYYYVRSATFIEANLVKGYA